MRNLRLDICYDGTRYRGWQRQSGGTDNTIQGKIETALSRILGEPIEISGSGRTDSCRELILWLQDRRMNHARPASVSIG